MNIASKLMGLFMAAIMAQRQQIAQYATANPGFGRRTRIKGKPGKAGAKLSRKAAERRVTLRHPGGVV